ncbi:RHS repeat-associated core domain-containing protein [Tenacibaculum sp. MAR_2009_124]|nr:RHS repeat-associated core domain-containing protein [Tenacibaculum sp. MAR_2009_124]
MLVPNRHGQADSYRYGFQGQEKDDEIKGEGNSVNYKFRMHDPRVGRFFAVDPLMSKYPHYSPYSFSGNKVIAFGELEGLEEFSRTTSIDWVYRGYRVMKGDNLSNIAKTTGVALQDILKFNPSIENADLVYEGQSLHLKNVAGFTTSMSGLYDNNDSNWLESFVIEAVTTNGNGVAIQSQAKFVLEAEMYAAGLSALRGGLPALSRYLSRKGRAKVPVSSGVPEPYVDVKYSTYRGTGNVYGSYDDFLKERTGNTIVLDELGTFKRHTPYTIVKKSERIELNFGRENNDIIFGQPRGKFANGSDLPNWQGNYSLGTKIGAVSLGVGTGTFVLYNQLEKAKKEMQTYKKKDNTNVKAKNKVNVVSPRSFK